MQQLADELEFVRFMHQHRQFDRVADAWITTLLQRGLLVKYNGSMFWVVDKWVTVAILWPATQVNIAGSMFWGWAKLDERVKLVFAPVLRFDDWLVYEISMVSPLLSKLQGCPGAQFLAKQHGKGVEFLKFAAQKAFWSTTSEFLNKVARLEYDEKLSKGTVHELAFQLIKIVLKCNDREACAYLGHRMVANSISPEVDELLQTAEFEDCISQSDAKVCDNMREETTSIVEERTSVQAFIKTKLGAPIKKKFTGSKTVFPAADSDITEEKVHSMAPKGARVRIDRFNGRWDGHFRVPPGPWLHVSRSWGSRSHKACVKQMLQALWRHAVAYGETCTVEGLFTPEGPPVRSSGAASSSGLKPA